MNDGERSEGFGLLQLHLTTSLSVRPFSTFRRLDTLQQRFLLPRVVAIDIDRSEFQTLDLRVVGSLEGCGLKGRHDGF